MIERDLYLGIDPGISGGIALLSANGDVVDLSPMPDTEKDVVDHLRELSPRVKYAVLEKVGPMPKQGIASTAKFMKQYGVLIGVLFALDIRFEDVRPQVWQHALNCRTGGDKNVSKRKAQQLFPQQKITHAVADAALIAEYARRSKQ